MFRKSHAVMVLIVTSTFSTSLCGEILTVPNVKPTIQEAIDVAQNGDTILVMPGTYTENIDFLGKNIIVGSLFIATNDRKYISQTIIDGGREGSVVVFTGGERSNAILSGFTITNGTGTYSKSRPHSSAGKYAHSGGGIFVNRSNPTLRNLVVKNNSAINTWSVGGGICYLSSVGAILEDVTITDNSAHSGGGWYCFQSNPTLLNVRVQKNRATSDGGGIFCYYTNRQNPRLMNVVVSGNTASQGGGGLTFIVSSPKLFNVLLLEGISKPSEDDN